MGELPVLPVLLSPLLPEDMLVLADMLPTLPVLFMLPSVRLRLSQRLKLMLVFCMEDMDMVVLDILDLDMVLVLAMLGMDMDILVLDMPDMVVMDLDMEDMVLDMAVPSMVKQVSYESKSSKAIFLLFSAPY